jgi:caa(3)-type oxidase subunit IV
MAHATTSGVPVAPKPHYRQYAIIFGALAVLTAVEIGVVYLPIAKPIVVTMLIVLALVKAGMVGLYFMHLMQETTILKLMVCVPLALGALYSGFLIWEAFWRVAWRFIGSARYIETLL